MAGNTTPAIKKSIYLKLVLQLGDVNEFATLSLFFNLSLESTTFGSIDAFSGNDVWNCYAYCDGSDYQRSIETIYSGAYEVAHLFTCRTGDHDERVQATVHEHSRYHWNYA